MRNITVGMVCIDPVVGDCAGNVDKMIAGAEEILGKTNPNVVVFSELCIGGYSSEDMHHWSCYQEYQWEELQRFIYEVGRKLPISIVGMVVEHRKKIYNCAIVMNENIIQGIVPKRHLANADVHSEQRVLSAWESGSERLSDIRRPAVRFGNQIFETDWGLFGVDVCEDIWSSNGNMFDHCYAGAEIEFNLSASQFRREGDSTRETMLSQRSADYEAILVYNNQGCGSNDALVYQGSSFVYACGTPIMVDHGWHDENPGGFCAKIATVNLDVVASSRMRNTTWKHDAERWRAKKIDLPVDFFTSLPAKNSGKNDHPIFTPAKALGLAEPVKQNIPLDIVRAQIAGLDGYFFKTGAFDTVWVALSGGADSYYAAVVSYLWAARAHKCGKLKKEPKDVLRFLTMPSKFNTDKTIGIAEKLSEELGIPLLNVPIQGVVEELHRAVGLIPLSDIVDHGAIDLSDQNLQPRARTAIIGYFLNLYRGLWIQTGNRTEKQVGYTTAWGDMAGSYSLTGDLEKTVLYQIMEDWAENGLPFKKELKDTGFDWMPDSLIDLLRSEASAELKPNQTDERDLMPFLISDTLSNIFWTERCSAVDLYDRVRNLWSEEDLRGIYKDKSGSYYVKGRLRNDVIRWLFLTFRSIWKWEQTPQAVHLSNVDLDRKRALRIPIVSDPSLRWLRMDRLQALEGDNII